MKTGLVAIAVGVSVVLELLLIIPSSLPTTNLPYANGLPSEERATTEEQTNPAASQAQDSGPSQSAPKYAKEQLEEFKKQNGTFLRPTPGLLRA